MTYYDHEKHEKAGNPNTSATILTKLSNDKDEMIRELVSGNPTTPPLTLAGMSTDNNYSIRYSIADNPGTSPSTLEELSNDVDQEVRRCAFMNVNYQRKLNRRFTLNRR